nr:pentatricopeptide repeat protein AaPPR335 [Agave angustifolia]UPT49071.1 pentatricopeptide repeat protein AaPPR1534 [Agave angustifolia]UPT49074.1 pentatricopeptide repeat protein AaPPR1539 [Agave angustifolia]UPT49312.1 pentatricopeptide repeat protein AaPPR209 [Agave angustifolia]
MVPNVYTYNSLLFGICKSGWCWKALSLFYCFRKRGFIPNVYSYTSLVMGFGNKGSWKEAYRILEDMRIDGFLPTVVTYTVLINCLCKYGLVDEGLRILKVMGEVGCHPDLITYNVLLGALSFLNRVSDAGQLIWVMEEKGLIPDQYTCCAVAAGLLKNGYVRESQDLLYRAVRGNIMDIVTWNIILCSLCVDNRVMEAISMLSCMIKRGFIPNNMTCNIILKGLCMECIDEALYFFDGVDWGKNGPDLISFNTVLSASCKQGNSPMIWRVLDRMDSEGVKPSVVTMTCLMQYFGEAGKYMECIKLFNYMIRHGYCPTSVTYNILLNNLCKKGFLSDAKRLFNEFKGIETFPDTTSYNILIHAYIKNGDFLLVQCLLFDMYSRGLVPDAITYGYLNYGLGKEKGIDAALDLEEQMVEDGVRPSVSYYNPILAALFRKDRLWDAFLILVKMEIDEVESDGRKRLSKAKKILEIIIKKAHIQSKVEAS